MIEHNCLTNTQMNNEKECWQITRIDYRNKLQRLVEILKKLKKKIKIEKIRSQRISKMKRREISPKPKILNLGLIKIRWKQL